MDAEYLLSVRWRERAELLRRVEQGIRRNCHVRAAWVTGSVARGDDDALSDLDMFIVVADDAIADFVDNRRSHAAGPAQPILLMDNLANAPVSGAYLLALYDGAAGPQHVDWFWQAESMARCPDDERILFDRAGLPVVPGAQWRSTVHRSSGPPLGQDLSLADLLTHKIAFFWAMSLVVAKYIARRNGKDVARMFHVVSRTLTEAEALSRNSVSLWRGDETMATGLEAASPAAQLQELKGLARHAEILGTQLTAHGVVVPSKAVLQVHQFFELTEAIATQDVNVLCRRYQSGPGRDGCGEHRH